MVTSDIWERRDRRGSTGGKRGRRYQEGTEAKSRGERGKEIDEGKLEHSNGQKRFLLSDIQQLRHFQNQCSASVIIIELQHSGHQRSHDAHMHMIIIGRNRLIARATVHAGRSRWLLAKVQAVRSASQVPNRHSLGSRVSAFRKLSVSNRRQRR